MMNTLTQYETCTQNKQYASRIMRHEETLARHKHLWDNTECHHDKPIKQMDLKMIKMMAFATTAMNHRVGTILSIVRCFLRWQRLVLATAHKPSVFVPENCQTTPTTSSRQERCKEFKRRINDNPSGTTVGYNHWLAMGEYSHALAWHTNYIIEANSVAWVLTLQSLQCGIQGSLCGSLDTW